MDEYIEREKAKRLLHIEYAYAAEQLLDEIPAADVAPAWHGRWEKCDNLKPKCSVCGEYHLYAWSDYRKCNYCPNCGAKMKWEDF